MTSNATTDRTAFAQRVTDGLEPKNWIILVTLMIGWNSGRWEGLAWGLFGIVLAAIIPIEFIKWGVRRGHWTDRHVGVRAHRLRVMTAIITSVAVAIGVMIAFHAPQAMIAMIAAMLTTLAGLMVITTRWKISVHAAVSAGAVAMITLTYGPLALLGYTLVILVAWSRVSLRDHTPAQVVSGGILGAAIATTTFLSIA